MTSYGTAGVGNRWLPQQLGLGPTSSAEPAPVCHISSLIPCLSNRAFNMRFCLSSCWTINLTSSSKHIRPRAVHVPAWGAVVIPYRWMLKESGFQIAQELELDAHRDREPESPSWSARTSWVQSHGKQRAIEPVVQRRQDQRHGVAPHGITIWITAQAATRLRNMSSLLKGCSARLQARVIIAPHRHSRKIQWPTGFSICLCYGWP